MFGDEMAVCGLLIDAAFRVRQSRIREIGMEFFIVRAQQANGSNMREPENVRIIGSKGGIVREPIRHCPDLVMGCLANLPLAFQFEQQHPQGSNGRVLVCKLTAMYSDRLAGKDRVPDGLEIGWRCWRENLRGHIRIHNQAHLASRLFEQPKLFIEEEGSVMLRGSTHVPILINFKRVNGRFHPRAIKKEDLDLFGCESSFGDFMPYTVNEEIAVCLDHQRISAERDQLCEEGSQGCLSPRVEVDFWLLHEQ